MYPSELYTPNAHPLRELAVWRDVVRLPRLAQYRRAVPRGKARVIVVPGFLTSDRVTWVMRQFLASLGYRVSGWGLGRNHGRVPELIEQLGEQVASAGKREPVHLVGWSLGGFIAREVAREHPGCVAQVITLGSPVVGGPKYTAGAGYYRDKLGVDLDALEQEISERDKTPLRVPITAFYSPIDAVVCPAATIDRVNPQTVHIEVQCSHAGFGFKPEVLAQVAERLGESLGEE